MSISEPTTIGLSDAGQRKLKQLQEQQYFHERLDGYRFAIALAIAHGVDPEEISNRGTMFNIGSLDPDQSIKLSIEAILGEALNGQSVYKYAERLAEWGVHELSAMAEKGGIDFIKILESASRIGGEK